MEAMTLEQVRDWHRAQANNQARPFETTLYRSIHDSMADAIDAHLAQPAQAVDVGAIREVIAECNRVPIGGVQAGALEAFIVQLAPKLTRALSGEKAGPVGDREYRLLGPGDVIEPDDEFIHDNAVDWVPLKTNPGAAQLFAGMQYRLGTLKQARRPIPASPTPDKEGA